VGGKGGFGATLRSQKPGTPMTTNFDACRDLSGRRIRHVNAQQNLEEWQQKQAEEENKIDQELKDFKDKEKQMKAAIHANTYKIDERYKRQLDISANNITNGVMLGKNRVKRKHKDLRKLRMEMDNTLVNEHSVTHDVEPKSMIKHLNDSPSFDDENRKRFKIDENHEKYIKDESEDHEEPSLVIPKKVVADIKLDEIPSQQEENFDETSLLKNSQKDTEKVINNVQPNLVEVLEVQPIDEKNEKAKQEADLQQEVFSILEKVTDVEDLKKYYSTEVVKDKLITLG